MKYNHEEVEYLQIIRFVAYLEVPNIVYFDVTNIDV